MRAQRLWRAVVAGKFSFGQGRVDFPVADVMQKNCWPTFAAFQLRNQVVQALRRVRWDGTATEWTDRVGQWSDPLQ